MSSLYTNQNKRHDLRVPLAFQVAAARDYCNRSNLNFPSAQDEIVGTATPFVFNTLVNSALTGPILLPADWFLAAMTKRYDLSRHLLSERHISYYLQSGATELLGRELKRLSSTSLKDMIAYY